MIIIRLYIWLESSLLIMRQRTNLFGRVWSMRPEWAQADRRKTEMIILLINRFNDFICSLMTGYDCTLHLSVVMRQVKCPDMFCIAEWMYCTVFPVFCIIKWPNLSFHLKKGKRMEVAKERPCIIRTSIWQNGSGSFWLLKIFCLTWSRKKQGSSLQPIAGPYRALKWLKA